MTVWLLKTLEKNPTSVFRKKNLLRKLKEQFEKLKTQGFLIYSQPDPDHETYPCTHPCTKACPMDVVNMQGKLFAICPEDTEVDPIPLTKDDISKYCYAIDILIKAIREANDFAGDNYPFNHRLHFIGEHVIGGINTAFILALFHNVQAAEPHLLSLPSRIPTNYEQIVVVTPSLSLTQEPIYAKLKNASMFPITLPPSFGQRDFKISYLDAIRKPSLAEPSVKGKKAEYVFRSDGDIWEVVYKGNATNIKHRKGMLYIEHLLKNPKSEFKPLELKQIIDPPETIKLSSDNDTVGEIDGTKKQRGMSHVEANAIADKNALRAYNDRLTQIKEELEEAIRNKDQAKEDKLSTEKDAILQQVRSSTAIKGRLRQFSGDEAKVRDTISTAIRRAIKNIKEHHEELSQHLDSNINRGNPFSYSPEPELDWYFE